MVTADRLEFRNGHESSTHPIPLSGEKTLCLFQQLRVDLGLGLAEEVGGVSVRLEDTRSSQLRLKICGDQRREVSLQGPPSGQG